MTAAFLIGEEGPLSGTLLSFEEGEEWILGRDPEAATVVLEDPMVSRRHAALRKSEEGYELENFSTVNPATQNGKVISELTLLREGDTLHIGSTYFRFTTINPHVKELESLPPKKEALLDISALDLGLAKEARWLLKVVSGPNSGAETPLQRGQTYILGKDAALCDIIFQDLSVSKQHARITVGSDEVVSIEDLNSRNGVVVNGQLIVGPYELASQDLVSLGTTAFLVIDREQAYETIIAKHIEFAPPPVKEGVEAAPPKSWKELIISKRALALAFLGALLFILSLAAFFALFKSEPVVAQGKDEIARIGEKMERFPKVQFSFNAPSGKIFLTGHVLTSTDQGEMLYFLHTLPFIETIENGVVIDELVWQNMNALLATNPAWEGVNIHAPEPGHFVMTGYLQTLEDLEALTDYVNLNFPYLDLLSNRVIVENTLQLEISKILEERNLNGVQFEMKNGELILAGRVDEQNETAFKEALERLGKLAGVRSVGNFVVLTKVDTSLVDLSSKYTVSGTSKKDNRDFYVVINGKILGKGDLLDGMLVTQIEPQRVVLEKDGVKFQINYNQQ